MGAKSKKRLKSVMQNLIAWLVSLTMIIPLLLILVNAFKPVEETYTLSLQLPKNWTVEHFAVVIKQGKLLESFFNSLLYAGAAMLITIFLGSMAAYFFARRKGRKNRIVYFYLVLGIVIPINYVALMKVMQMVQMNNTALGIILLYTATQLPFTVFLLYGFVCKIPVDLDEAAVIDGCGPIRLFISIIMPMLKPGMVTAGVLCFLNDWNEFIMPLYFLNSSEKWPMTLAVYNFFGQFEKSWNLICADILLTCLPVIIMYLLCQRYIVGGQTAGAVKG
ncbi:carbohydrate ABC transporter permease [Muricomes sp. OA1]|nr:MULTISPECIES: carbohydrate ABC transporter permease [Clostridia]MCH1974959.1 carbohydrate ABC transporter permease [Muricomes sp. OA1]MEE0203218.1 carbohydrate ABC transporter permease [Muricomes sp.]GKH33787.1 sugar ABC transporter permease [Faecalicatena contorta]